MKKTVVSMIVRKIAIVLVISAVVFGLGLTLVSDCIYRKLSNPQYEDLCSVAEIALLESKDYAGSEYVVVREDDHSVSVRYADSSIVEGIEAGITNGNIAFVRKSYDNILGKISIAFLTMILFWSVCSLGHAIGQSHKEMIKMVHA